MVIVIGFAVNAVPSMVTTFETVATAEQLAKTKISMSVSVRGSDTSTSISSSGF